MASSSYRYWRTRRKAEILSSKQALPSGNWVLVSKAAKLKGYSKMTIMMRFYKSQCDGYKIGDGPLLVNLDQIK